MLWLKDVNKNRIDTHTYIYIQTLALKMQKNTNKITVVLNSLSVLLTSITFSQYIKTKFLSPWPSNVHKYASLLFCNFSSPGSTGPVLTPYLAYSWLKAFSFVVILFAWKAYFLT